VCPSIVKRPFCIPSAMEVFADMRPSLVLVVLNDNQISDDQT
jgi:hypothetical protein